MFQVSCECRVIFTHCRTEVRLPVHFRYQPPSLHASYIPVVIPTPLVFMPHPLGSASLPCHPYTRDTCLWELVAFKDGDEAGAELALQVPCGHRGYLSHVIVAVTTCITLAATVAILCSMGKMEIWKIND